MILMYEDEAVFVEDYIEAIREADYKIEIFKDANSFLKRVDEVYNEIELFIIDIMVFGRGNEFENGDSDGGAKSGLVLLDYINKIEKNFPNISPPPRIIFTNRKGPVFEQAKNDKRIYKAIKKSSVFPSEFVDIIRSATNKGSD